MDEQDPKTPKDDKATQSASATETAEGESGPKATTPQRVNIKIQADDETARGVYSNSAMVNINENEVTLDFVYIPPQSPKGHLRSRVVLTPRQAKQLVRVLGDSVQRYERRFGPIPELRKRNKPVLH